MTTQVPGQSARNTIDIEETASLARHAYTGMSAADAEADIMLVSAGQNHPGQGNDGAASPEL